FQTRMISRVRKLGFNAIGDFSGVSQAARDAKFPWVAGLPGAGAVEGLRGIFDPFDPQVATQLDTEYAQSIKPAANEPLLIGYFLENEQAFEDIPRVIPSLKATQPAKVRLVDMLQKKYATIAAFNTAWGMKEDSFDGLKDTGLPVTTAAASADMNDFTGQYIEAYYRLIHDTFRKYDTHHMLIGNRWQPGTANSEQLCRIAGKYCEMLSLNYYTYGVDKTYLKRLYDWSGGKPFMLSEFYWSSPAESGLPGGNELKTERERGLAYRNYIEQAASTGFVVGIEWFTLIDQARTGRWFERYNGERANTGLFNVADRPYKDFLAEASTSNYGIYDVLLGKRPPFSWNDPRFEPKGSGQKVVSIPRAVGAIKLDGTRNGWPGIPPETVPSSRLVMGADSAGLDGSFRLCWDDQNLYVMAQVSDPTPMKNTEQGAGIWNGDGVELFIGAENVDTAGPLLFTDRQVLLSAGQPADGKRSFIAHAPQQVPADVFVAPAVDGKGYVLEAAIPFTALGFTPKEGQAIRFDLGIDDGNGAGRVRQLMWSGGARNSGDRSDWGRGKFVR
ncbi:MAG: CBM9 family sugar-binding protein, partial [Armatimonadota bacterium]|nr:CBM9 family sugar-binding protein [Armatimonadota bacterium]